MKGTSWKTDADGFERQPLLADTCRGGNAHGGMRCSSMGLSCCRAAWGAASKAVECGESDRRRDARQSTPPPWVTKPRQGAATR